MPEQRREEVVDEHLVSTIDGWYEVVTKDAEGVAHVNRLYKHSTKTRPLHGPDGDPMDLLVTQAPPSIIRSKPARGIRANGRKILTASDAQIGYRRTPEGIDNFHDERALSLCVQMARVIQPDVVVVNGDLADFAPLSRYDQRRDWQETTQLTIDRAHRFLAELVAAAPSAEFHMTEGNHERRLGALVMKYTAELAGLRRANSDDDPALALSNLLRLRELGITYHTGYPKARVIIGEGDGRISFTHGDTVAPSGATAARVVGRAAMNTVFGHIQRVEIAYRTIDEGRARQIFAATYGGLMSVSGNTPGVTYSVDDRGHTVEHPQNWQQAMGYLVQDGSLVSQEPIIINDGRLIFRDKVYEHGTTATK